MCTEAIGLDPRYKREIFATDCDDLLKLFWICVYSQVKSNKKVCQ